MLYRKEILLNVRRVLETSSAMVEPRRFVSFRKSSAVFGNRRWPSEIFWNNPDLSQNGRKLVDIYILNKTILAFLEPFFASSSWKKFNVSKNFLPLVLKCLKFNCFMLQSQNSEVFSVIEVPPFRPSLRDSLNNCQSSRGLTVCVLTKKKKRFHRNNRMWKDSAKTSIYS